MSRRGLRPAFVAVLLATPGFGFGCAGGNAPQAAVEVVTKAPARQPGPVPADAAPVPGGKPATDFPIERKIIFNGRIEVVVKEFDSARAEATRIVEANKGYLAKTEVAGDAGTKRSGTFTIKVPAEKFQATVDAFARLGVAVKNSTDSQDVTEEFVDIAARVKNLKAEEEVFNRLLKDAAGRLDDVFKIREQIRQVRGDIERAEGRMKALASLAAMSTLVLTLREESEYVPPTVEAPSLPTFDERVSGTFAESLGLLRQVGEWIALVATAAAPWLPLVIAGGLVLRWVARRLPDPGSRITIQPPARPREMTLPATPGEESPPG